MHASHSSSWPKFGGLGLLYSSVGKCDKSILLPVGLNVITRIFESFGFKCEDGN